jgi:hypothetical protein
MTVGNEKSRRLFCGSYNCLSDEGKCLDSYIFQISDATASVVAKTKAVPTTLGHPLKLFAMGQIFVRTRKSQGGNL